MTKSMLFWVLMLLWLVLGCWISYAPFMSGSYHVGGLFLFPFLLFTLLGWQVFGQPIQ